jgi:GNAT superfamily N-acetyltransferase
LIDVDFREQEENEASWWSYWGETRWVGRNAYIITSKEFEEPLFNHAVLIDPDLPEQPFIDNALASFAEAGTQPSFFVIRTPLFAPLNRTLRGSGFSVLEKMYVLAADPTPANEPIGVSFDVEPDLRSWASVYLNSFYGDQGLQPCVERATRMAAKDKAVSLVLVRRGKEALGGMALYRSENILGVYCVGTLPRHRRTGVASSLLSFASRIARDEGLSLVLQTFSEDGVEGFYAKRGFGRIYEKEVLMKPGVRASP